MPNPLDDAKVYTLDDLKSWETLRPGLPPSLAVLGHPVAHSVSPQMHNAALAELAKTHSELKEWRYFKFDIAQEELDEALKVLRERNFLGINLTVPHKIDALKYVPAISDDAKIIGAINTLLPQSAHGWGGVNTDPYGLQEALMAQLNISLKNKSVVVLGAGGAARTTVDLCHHDNVQRLWVGNRTLDKAIALINEFYPNDHRASAFALGNPPAAEWPKDVVVIDATSASRNQDEPVLDVKLLGKDATIFDTNYRKSGGTPIIEAARKAGLRFADGLGMLVWQGAASLGIWINKQHSPGVESYMHAQIMMTAACKALGRPDPNA